MGRKKLTEPLPKAPPKRKPGSYSRLTDLEPGHQAAVDMMLLRGDSLGKVASVMRDEWQVCLDVLPNSLVKTLQRYREKILIPRAQNFQAKVAAGAIGQDERGQLAAKATFERLNVMDHYEEIIDLQIKRIRKLYEREAKLPEGLILESLTKLFKDYNHSLDRYAFLQMETGFIKRAPKVLQGQLGFVDPDNPDARPTFEIAFEVQQLAQQGVATLAGLVGEVIEGEYARVKSSGEPLSRPTAAQRRASEGAVPAGADDDPVRPAGRPDSRRTR